MAKVLSTFQLKVCPSNGLQPHLLKTLSAVTSHGAAVCGGKGGGKPDSAMGGGTELLKVDDALASVDDFVSEKLS